MKIIWEHFKINIQSIMEYRINFLLQTIGMFLNDVVWVVFWLIFFTKFTNINNWGFNDMIMLYAVLTLSWGILGILFGNFQNIGYIVRDGGLDYYLSLPVDELINLLTSNIKFQAFGDLFFGIILVIIFLPITKLPLLLILVTLSAILLLSFGVILGSLSFFIGSSGETARQGLFGILSISSYPISIFKGWPKIFLLTIIPAGFVTGIPVELLKNFNLNWFIYMTLATITFATIAITMFKLGVKKYESGNLINVRN